MKTGSGEAGVRVTGERDRLEESGVTLLVGGMQSLKSEREL